MAEIPPANELEDWLHQLPTNHFEQIDRYDGTEPTDSTTFELLRGNIVVAVTINEADAPPLEIMATAPVYDSLDLLQGAAFQSGLAQMAGSLPGWAEVVDRDDPAAIENRPCVVFHAPIYADGLTKHRLLTWILTLAEAALRAQMVAIDATVDDS